MKKKNKNIKKAFYTSVICATMFGAVLTGKIAADECNSCNVVEAAEQLRPTAYNNTSVYLQPWSCLTATDKGYMRVYLNNKNLKIEYYDNEFNVTGKKQVKLELENFGGFYAGSDAYYVVEGRLNASEDDNAEVIRVNKYNKNWKKIGTAKITGNTDLFGGEVRDPFDYGCVEFTEVNGVLYIVTGHEGYVDPKYNQGHQGFLMVAVNEKTMKGKIVASDLWHSFAQYIQHKGNDLYVLEQSEGSRYAKITKYDKNYNETEVPVLRYGGKRDSAWSIPCYATVNGLALSNKNVLSAGTSIDQSKYGSDSTYNVYLSVTPMSGFNEKSTKIKWITNHKNDNAYIKGVNITKINDNRFLVSWAEYNESRKADDNDSLSGNILHYVFVDGNGNKIGNEFKANATFSDCRPIVKGSKIVFYASDYNTTDFYIIDSKTGKFSKKVLWEKVGWVNEGGAKYYSKKNGKAYTGWHYMGAAEGETTPHWSYFGYNGVLYTGWRKMSRREGENKEHWSYFGDNGWLRTGWQQMGKGTKNPDGNAAKHWSYFGPNGWLRTGWQQMGKGTSNPDGNTAKHWSYFGDNGWLRTGLQSMGRGTSNPDGYSPKHLSYFGNNGWLVTNRKFSVAGRTYTADGRGWAR